MKLFEKIRPLPLGFDMLLAAAVLVLGVIGTVAIAAGATSQLTRSSDGVPILLIVLMAAPLALQRVHTTPF